MPMGMSERGSIMWHALDGATLQGNRFERRTISDALLDAWAGPAVDNAPCYALRRAVPVIFCSTWGRAF